MRNIQTKLPEVRAIKEGEIPAIVWVARNLVLMAIQSPDGYASHNSEALDGTCLAGGHQIFLSIALKETP